MLTANGMALLGLSGLLGSLALLVDKAFTARQVLLLSAAALFGVALGLRAALTDCALPLAPVVRFVTMASFATVAFHRCWTWIHQKLP